MANTVRDAMTENPRAIGRDSTVVEAANIMRDEDVGIVPIVDGDKLVGTLTDRDIAIRVVAEGKDPNTTKAEQVASGLYRLCTMMVNVYFVRDRAAGGWVLVDTGLPGYAGAIRRMSSRDCSASIRTSRPERGRYAGSRRRATSQRHVAPSGTRCSASTSSMATLR